MLKKILLVFSSIIITTTLLSFTKEKKQKALRTIIIDAGHGIKPGGGRDGARGAYSYEDDICFDISKKLVILLKKEFPEIAILETRFTPNYVGLKERANFANQRNGDLFISIHVNAAPPVQHREFTGNKSVVSYTGKGKNRKKVTKQIPQYRYYTSPNPAKGTETYIWGAHKNDHKDVAIRENAPMLGEENYKQKYGDIDPNSPEFIALSLLKTKQFFKRSATFAGMVEDEFIKVGRVSRGEKQRQVGIWVLQATAMPSVLVETGYITNRTEEDYLNSKEGQQEIAECIKNALKNYVTWIEKQQTSVTHNKPLNTSSVEAYRFLEAIQHKEEKHLSK